MLCGSGGSGSRKKSFNNIVCSTGKFNDDDMISEELRTNDGEAIMSSCTLNRVDDSIETDVTSQRHMFNALGKFDSSKWLEIN